MVTPHPVELDANPTHVIYCEVQEHRFVASYFDNEFTAHRYAASYRISSPESTITVETIESASPADVQHQTFHEPDLGLDLSRVDDNTEIRFGDLGITCSMTEQDLAAALQQAMGYFDEPEHVVNIRATLTLIEGDQE